MHNLSNPAGTTQESIVVDHNFVVDQFGMPIQTTKSQAKLTI